MSWIYDSMEENISRSFCHCKIAEELKDSAHNSYAQKWNHARINQMTRELANLNQGGMSVRDYRAQIQGMERT